MAGPLASNMLREGQTTYFTREGKPWRQRSTEDHGAVGEWITPRIWIEVGTGTLAVKGEVESAKNEDNATGAREDVTSLLKNVFHFAIRTSFNKEERRERVVSDCKKFPHRT